MSDPDLRAAPPSERDRVKVALTRARETTNSLYSDLTDLLTRWGHPCVDSCQHAHCPLLRALGQILEERRTEIFNARRADDAAPPSGLTPPSSAATAEYSAEELERIASIRKRWRIVGEAQFRLVAWAAHYKDDVAWLLARLDAPLESTARAAPDAPTSPVAGAPEGRTTEMCCTRYRDTGEWHTDSCHTATSPVRGLTPDVERVVRALRGLMRDDGHAPLCPGAAFHDRPEHDCEAIRRCDAALAALRVAPAASRDLTRHIAEKHEYLPNYCATYGPCRTPPAAPGPGR